MGTAIANYTGKQLLPLFFPELAGVIAGTFMPNLTVAQGTVLGQVSASSVNEVQTLNFSASGDVPNGGTFTLAVTGIDGGTFTTDALAYGISNANLKIAVEALFVSAGYVGVTVTLTNGPAPADVTVTFGGTAAAWNIPLMVASNALTSAGTATLTVDATTAGVTKGLWGPYVGSKLANPTVAPTVASKTGGSVWPVLGQYIVQYSFATAQGETLLSPGTPVALTTTDRTLAVSSITLPAGATAINFYVNGVYAAQITATGAKDIDAIDTDGEHPAPIVNTAFTNTDGRHVARGIAVCSFRTDNMGRVVFGGSSSIPQGAYDLNAPLFISGCFDTKELVGLSADAISDLGRLLSGALADGVLKVG